MSGEKPLRDSLLSYLWGEVSIVVGDAQEKLETLLHKYVPLRLWHTWPETVQLKANMLSARAGRKGSPLTPMLRSVYTLLSKSGNH